MSGYLDSRSVERLDRDYPTGQAFLDRYTGMSRDELRSIQESRFLTAVEAAWQTQFYRRIWGAAGLEPGDVRLLDDLPHLPVIDKAAIMADIAEHPPFGSLSSGTPGARPQVLQTTSGTTGDPQPVLWGAWGREVQNALLGRCYVWAGVREGDIAQSFYGHGPVNGGHYIREALARYTDALVLTTGTGQETRTEQQVRMMRRFGTTVLVGFADYIRKVAAVARDLDVLPERDLAVRLIVGHLPRGTREEVEAAWPGAIAFDWYGVADTGIVTAEGPDRDGHWIWEDANVLEVLDVDTHAPLPDGEAGDMVVTSLGKSDVAPLIRFNTHDLTRVLTGAGAFDLPFRRTDGMLGRSDQMVKLRGINVYPTALSALLRDVPGSNGEYYCRLERREDGADRLVVVIETGDSTASAEGAAESLSKQLGVKVDAELVPEGATSQYTEVASRQKPRRLVDVRA